MARTFCPDRGTLPVLDMDAFEDDEVVLEAQCLRDLEDPEFEAASFAAEDDAYLDDPDDDNDDVDPDDADDFDDRVLGYIRAWDDREEDDRD